MAKGKNTIIVYRDWKTIFDKLTDNEAGQLIKHLFAYINDENPQSDRLIELVFEPIRLTLKRDLKEWESTLEKRSKAGLASAEKRKQNQHMSTHVESVQQEPTNSTDIDIDIDSDSVINININNEFLEVKNQLTDEIWKEQFCMKLKISPETFDLKMNEFLINAELTGEYKEKNMLELKSHFFNIINKYKKELENGSKTNSGNYKNNASNEELFCGVNR